jgi:hypothetical protein
MWPWEWDALTVDKRLVVLRMFEIANDTVKLLARREWIDLPEWLTTELSGNSE